MYSSTEKHRARVVTQNRSPSFPGCERLTVQGQASAAKPVNTGAAHNLPWHLVLQPVYNSQPDILQYIGEEEKTEQLERSQWQTY